MVLGATIGIVAKNQIEFPIIYDIVIIVVSVSKNKKKLIIKRVIELIKLDFKNFVMNIFESKPIKYIKMNKVDLINAVAEKAGMTKVDARKAVDAMMGVTKDELMKGGKLGLVGFGTLSVNERPARQGRNPRTGKTIKIAAKKVVKFKAASNLLK